MGMMLERLPPRVKDGEKADFGTEMLRVGRNAAKRLGRRVKQDAVDHFPVLKRDAGNPVGHGKDDVEVRGRE